MICSLLLMTGCTVSNEQEALVETDLEQGEIAIEENVNTIESGTESKVEDVPDVIEVADEEVKDESPYILYDVSYPEEAKIDLHLMKMVGTEVLWKRTWKDIYLTELSPYSELVETDGRLYLEVFGSLYGLSAETGADVFDPVLVGAGERPVVDEDGAVYYVGYYGPFATKVAKDGTVLWQIDYLDDFYWPWELKAAGDYLYITCDQMEDTAINLLQVDKMTGTIRNGYWTERDSVIFETVKASSTLEGYPATYVLDNDKSTAWVEGLVGDGSGESIVFEHHKPQKVSKIVLLNGYHKTADLYKANNRVKDMDIIFSNGQVIHYSCADARLPIEIEFEAPIETDHIEIVIRSVYLGAIYDDTAITGIEFY